MSKPMTADELLRQLKDWRIRYSAPFADWKTHNRGARGNGFNDVKGFMVHHTGSDSQFIANYLYRGTSALPGPLCHYGLTSSGVVELIGHGRANHAGSGDSAVLDKVIRESYSGVLKPKKEDSDGNGYFYGVEVYYSGSHGMTPTQYAALIKLAAAVCEHHGWSAKSVIGHGEWTPEKWDPGYKSGTMMDMNALRSDVQRMLDAGPGGRVDAPVVSGEKKPSTKPAAYKQVWNTDAMKRPKNMGDDNNPYWEPESLLRAAVEMAAEAKRNTDEILRLMKESGK